MSNKQLFKDTFDRVTLSDEALRKVKNMNNPMNNKKKVSWRLAAAMTLAAFAVLFVSGNVITYAATGESLVGKVNLLINGKKAKLSDISSYTDKKNGEKVYKVTVDDAKSEIRVNEEAVKDSGISLDVDTETDNKTSIAIVEGVVKKKGNRVYLVVAGSRDIDITKDLEDGRAEGTFKMDGQKYRYSVKGTVKDNTVDIQKAAE